VQSLVGRLVKITIQLHSPLLLASLPVNGKLSGTGKKKKHPAASIINAGNVLVYVSPMLFEELTLLHAKHVRYSADEKDSVGL
jgi:hypothetical protein